MVRLPRTLPRHDHGKYQYYQEHWLRELAEFVRKESKPFVPQISAPAFMREPIQAFVEHELNAALYFKGAQSVVIPEGELEFEFYHPLWNRLLTARTFILNRAAYQNAFISAVEYIAEYFAPVEKCVAADPARSFITVPVYQLLPDARQVADGIVEMLSEPPYLCSGLFHTLHLDVERNLQQLHPDRAWIMAHKDVKATKSKLSTRRVLEEFFHGTPILDLFMHKVPLAWEYRDRFAHTHIIGRTRAGKTTLMERMIAEDLTSPAKPSLVVMTPHRELIRSLSSYAGVLGDRLLIVDPSDEKYPPAINPFHSKRPVRPNHVIATFDYILASLGLELTPKQTTLWNYTVRMLLALPKARGRNATIVDISDFLSNPLKFTGVIDTLPEHDRAYFYEAIVPPTSATGKIEKTIFDGTREEIGYRLRNVLFNDAARDVLSAPETKIDFFEELNRGSVILIDTAKGSIGEASTVFGGMVLALIMQAMLARDDHDKRLWHPTFIYVDECANYMSDDISEMLTELRKFNCGLILAHHELAQANERSQGLKASIVSQPAIRFAHPSSKDAPELAKEMRTSPEFLETLAEYHFAHFIHGRTPHAVSVKIAPPRHPTITVAQREVFKWRNRDRVSAGQPARESQSPQPSAEPDEEIDRKW